MKNETIKVTSAVGANNPPNEAPPATDRHAAALAEKRKHQATWPEPASVARDRLREATKESFAKSQQYRPAQDGTPIVGSGEA